MSRKRDRMAVKMPKHLLESQDVTLDLLYEIFNRADKLKKMEHEGKFDTCLKNRSVIFIHDQPSSRTIESYAEATLDLGGRYRSVFVENSSMRKDESLEATVMTYGDIGKDVVIIRYSDANAIYRAAVRSKIPVINAGSSSDQHPSQGILDLKTIFDREGKLEGTAIVFAGNLAEGRASNSAIYQFSRIRDVHLILASPEKLKVKGPLRWHLHKREQEGIIKVTETSDLRWGLRQVRFLYQTRDQKEMSENPKLLALLKDFWITRQMLIDYPDLEVLHPLPHNDELPTELEDHPRVLIHKQMRNGKFTRQAWLQMLAEHHLDRYSS